MLDAPQLPVLQEERLLKEGQTVVVPATSMVKQTESLLEWPLSWDVGVKWEERSRQEAT